MSGLPINNYAFYGFVPKQESKKKQFFSKIKDIGLTSVIFVSSIHLEKTIRDIVEFIGEREIAICKEMTKLHETFIRDDIKTLKMVAAISPPNFFARNLLMTERRLFNDE